MIFAMVHMKESKNQNGKHKDEHSMLQETKSETFAALKNNALQPPNFCNQPQHLDQIGLFMRCYFVAAIFGHY